MCGTSKVQQNAYDQAKAVQQDFVTNMNQVFATNKNILSNITAPLEKTVSAGQNQYGFTPEEDAARKTNILETNSAATRQASNIMGEKLGAVGDPNLASGSRAALTGDIAERGALATSGALQNETAEGYAVGRTNYGNAVRELASAPGELENPATAMESQALQGTENLSKSADAITASNRAWEKPVLGALGAVADVATGGLSGVAGKVGDAADSFLHS
jgi:hypothetical protein